ncbi:hypothetical protein NPIL_441801 [Nephila pilipes]|uniref:Uncharacterized protein n=1 Tax=Nephila pilipes TaxID=299642 RepID=A0A8X6IPF0_NEPPI|nr:hypothetical protein NPIL_441801 [Nephila pilipes]
MGFEICPNMHTRSFNSGNSFVNAHPEPKGTELRDYVHHIITILSWSRRHRHWLHTGASVTPATKTAATTESLTCLREGHMTCSPSLLQETHEGQTYPCLC